MLNINGTTLLGLKNYVNKNTYDTLHLPANITTITSKAFFVSGGSASDCSSLPDNINILDFPTSTKLTNIGDYAFYRSPFTNNIVFPTSLNSIGKYCFGMSRYITGIDLSNTKLTVIPDSAFTWLDSATSLIFNNLITTIKGAAFSS
jgi:hypothetical protein